MKVFRDAAFIGDLDDVESFVQAVRANPPPGLSAEPNNGLVKKSIVLRAETGLDKFTPFRVVLAWTSGSCKVTNIVPAAETVHRIEMDEYNAILGAVVPLLEEYAVKVGLSIEELPGETDLSRWLTEDAIAKLHGYSSLANRSIPHPLDQDRWREFICQVFRDGSDLSPNILERYMNEELGWTSDQASEHAIDFEQGLALLKHFTEGSRQFPRSSPHRN